MNALERLNELVKEKGPLLAGLDPDIDKILSINEETQKFSEKDYKTNREFQETIMKDYCINYIEAVKKEVVAIKINIAFFEAYGMVEVFWDIITYTKMASDLFIIADVKCGDIENTSKYYAKAFLNKDSLVDAITINPYVDIDGVKPFVDMAKENGKGVFVLVKTSNKESKGVPYFVLKDDRKVYQEVAELVKQWGEYAKTSDNEKYSLVGAEVGAIYPEEAKQLREQMPNTFFLVTGYGEQGATADDIVVNFDNDCGGAIVNSSRGLMFAYEKAPWKCELEINYWPAASHEQASRTQKELMEEIKKNKKTE